MMSSVYEMKPICPKTDPRDTERCTGLLVHQQRQTLECNQTESQLHWMANHSSRTTSRIWWSTVSKAALRCTKPNSVTVLLLPAPGYNRRATLVLPWVHGQVHPPKWWNLIQTRHINGICRWTVANTTGRKINCPYGVWSGWCDPLFKCGTPILSLEHR